MNIQLKVINRQNLDLIKLTKKSNFLVPPIPYGKCPIGVN